jgi:hypothetical protein
MIRVVSVLFGFLLFVTVASISGHEAGKTMVSTSCAAVQSAKVQMSSAPCDLAFDWCSATTFPDGTIIVQVGEPIVVTP